MTEVVYKQLLTSSAIGYQEYNIYLHIQNPWNMDNLKHYVKLISIAVCLFIVSLNAFGNPFAEQRDVRQFTMTDGLNHFFVDDMLIDSNGFLWVGTAGGGLQRYDAYNFEEFRSDNNDRFLNSNYIIKITEDRHKRLWVAARDCLEIIDIEGMKKIMPADKTGKLHDLIRKRTFYVSTDALGRIWINNIDGVTCVTLDHKTGDVTNIAELKGIYHEPNLIVIKDVCKDGNPWIMTDGKVSRLKHIGNNEIEARAVSEKLEFDNTELTASDFLTKDSDVWIATNEGVVRYNFNNDNMRFYTADSSIPDALSHGYTTSLAITGSGRLLVGNSRGIDEYNAMSDNFIRYDKDNDGMQYINCLLSDGKRVWAGTERTGLLLFSPHKPGLKTYIHHKNESNSISPSPINAVYQDNNGIWWIGSSEHGLSKADSDFNSFIECKDFNNKLSNPSVTSICSDNDGYLWIGTWGKGIASIHPSDITKITTHVIRQTHTDAALEFVTFLIYDKINRLLWISTNKGLVTYDKTSGSVSIPFPEASRGTAWMLGGAVESDSILWLGGKYGLYKVNLKNRNSDGSFRVKHYRTRLDSLSSNSIERISALCITGSGDLWIGSSVNGLYHRKKDTSENESFDRFTTRDGLPGNSIISIHEDADRRLWIATTKGIACRKNDGSYVTFSNQDLIPSGLFSENASYVGRNGNLVFGTSAGLVEINPSVISLKPDSYNEVKITSINIDGATAQYNRTDKGNEKVVMHESDKALEIGFSALDYDKSGSSGGRYFCRLKGFETAWDTLPPGRHHARYTNLPAGEYVFEVTYQPNGASMEEAPVSRIKISVKPPFYKKGWFVISFVLLMILIVYGIYKWRINDLTKQKKHLQKTVKERTLEISGQKNLLELQNEQLRKANVEVTHQKIKLAEMVEQVKTLTTERINFFTSITHEFRTPVTLILGPIKRALKLSNNPTVIEQLNFAEQNSRYLLSLINQIMDFRKVESGVMNISISKGDFRSFITGIFESFIPFSSDLGIQIRLILRLSEDEFPYADDALRKVVINLLSNALKYTPKGGVVTLYAATLTDKRKGVKELYICVSDTGPGIPEDDLSNIFDRFYQGHGSPVNTVNGTSGSGIGLYLCKNIITTCGGNIFARNNHGKGCSVRVIVPINPEECAIPQNKLIEPISTDSHIVETNDKDSDEESLSVMTVMVVEDNVTMRKYIKSILHDKYNVLEASNGLEALDILAKKPVDFIITDLMMPVMDGNELSRKLKSDITTSHIPVLVLTAKASQQNKIESYKIGVDEYLSKPFDEDLLLARIDNIIQNKRRYQKNFAHDMDVESLNVADNSIDKKFLEKVMKIVGDNYQDSGFEASDFADMMGMSRNILNQKMLSLVGQTSWQFVKGFRLKEAYKLMMKNKGTHKYTISEIAYDTGFSDPKYFSKCFSKQYGLSPRSFMNEGDDSSGNDAE